MREIPIAICGLGTVGSAVVELLNQHQDLIAAKHGFTAKLVQVGVRNSKPKCDIGAAEQERDLLKIAADPRTEIVIELIGGVDAAYELTKQAFLHNKHVITANKALIAAKGDELFALARAQGVGYFYEAAVAGGIPIIKVIQQGLAANRINRIVGIINGTCNYILSEMLHKQATFAQALQAAQQLGYAEADPTFDIDGSDAAHKIAILASLAFDMPLAEAQQQGIESLLIEDIQLADELGFVIKHLAVAQLDDGKLNLHVHPTLVRQGEAIAAVDGVLNGVMIDSEPLGRSFYSGAGAGGPATASAVLADLVDAVKYRAENRRVSSANNQPQLADPLASRSEFYLRLQLEDETGVMAQVTEILSDLDIGIEALIQKDASAEAGQHQVPVIIITHAVSQQSINEAIDKLKQLPQVAQQLVKLPILSN